ncbi:MAG TPA: hypothetical protein VIT89_10085 [Solirubrobacterales bacterium]
MKLKALGLAAVMAMALTAYAAGSASATTLELGGVKHVAQINVFMHLKTGTSAIWSRTDGSLANTCKESNIYFATNVGTGSTVTGPLSSLFFYTCDRSVEVHKEGTLHIANISGTTDGTVSSSGAEVTVGSPFGTLTCVTGTGVDLGRLTGTDGTPSTHAEMHVNAVLNCGFLVPSGTLKGTYIVTAPTNLGVSA